MNQGLGTTIASESEHTRCTRELEHALEQLKENLSKLFNKLEPVRLSDPRLDKPEQPTPEAPLSPINNFIHASYLKVQTANKAITVMIHEIQL